MVRGREGRTEGEGGRCIITCSALHLLLSWSTGHKVRLQVLDFLSIKQSRLCEQWVQREQAAVNSKGTRLQGREVPISFKYITGRFSEVLQLSNVDLIKITQISPSQVGLMPFSWLAANKPSSGLAFLYCKLSPKLLQAWYLCIVSYIRRDAYHTILETRQVKRSCGVISVEIQSVLAISEGVSWGRKVIVMGGAEECNIW